jgi:cellulose synthase/poly-beta-1,6-N-acetylglucosamine synthase-like glycosyltransferase/peptidoglycan/xylan/chitin deacetylase (PgdA/CDA1 family)/spore germination protein YaaH
MADKPIFFDATGRRAARITAIGWALAILGVVVFTGFAASVFLSPPVTSLNLPGHTVAVAPSAETNLVRRARKPGLLPRAERLAEAARMRRAQAARETRMGVSETRTLPAILKPQPGRALAIGYYVNWAGSRDASFTALKNTLPRLDWVVPTWLRLDGPDLTFKVEMDKETLDYMRARKPGIAVLPMLQNVTAGNWDGPGLQKLLADPARRKALLDKVIEFIAAHKLQGVTIDFEQVPQTAHPVLQKFLTEMSAAFSSRGWIIAQAAPFDDDDWPYKAYAGIIDYTMLMAYDEHEDSGTPGSIAGQNWYERILDKRMKELPPDSTIIAIGSYGYDWTGGKGGGYPLGFEDAMVAARAARATIQFDADTNNPRFSYMEDARNGGARHDIWFLDAVTAFNQIHAADPYQPAGYALWRLGSEDPSMRVLLGRKYNLPAPDSLKRIPINTENIDFDGRGEILEVTGDPAPGARELEIEDGTGAIVDERYTQLATSYVIRRIGALPKKLAITFDDGPDPAWTPRILEILKAKHVPATFFMIGEAMEANPGLVQRVLAEGHEVGNHTYTHPNLAEASDTAIRLELNASQRLFQALTGRSLRLFRSPYLSDSTPTDAEQIVPIERAQELGYIEVGANLDTLDWQQLPVPRMMELVFRGLHHPNIDLRGNVILMHDSGGDRSQTIALLPVLIDTLRAQGYEFVPVSHLAGFSRDAIMPRLPLTVGLYTDRVVFLAIGFARQFLYYCFLGAIVLGVGRLLLLAGLAAWKKLRGEGEPPDFAGAPPGVTVLIPAFNEEKVIVKTVERILASDYPDLDVLVIDDGSKDHTAFITRSHFVKDKRVRLISIPNGGKANALNVGLAAAENDIVVALDADTQFNPDTIRRLARWFADETVGAVAGNAKVGNRVNMITRWQALEYIVAQNLERRALSALDTLTVVPGAVGAWRRKALLDLGGFPADTLAEDQDLTIAIQTKGYRVAFDSGAIAWTEAPTTVRALAKQRFRWAYGTLQCLWKYRGITLNTRYRELGMIALPQVWLFQIILTTLAPVADLLLVWQLIGEYLNYLEHEGEFSSANLQIVLVYYVVFMVVDVLAGVVGFAMEKGEDWRLLWWLPLQRFGYRQIMYYVVLRSIWAAVRGPVVGWGKLERTGTVKAAFKS